MNPRLLLFENRPEPVYDIAEYVGCNLGVVSRRVRRFLVPLKASSCYGTGQNSLAVGNSAECSRIEATEGMKWIAFYRCALDGLIDEAEVKRSIVSHEYCASAASRTNRTANLAEYALQTLSLVECRAQRMMRVDTVHGE